MSNYFCYSSGGSSFDVPAVDSNGDRFPSHPPSAPEPQSTLRGDRPANTHRLEQHTSRKPHVFLTPMLERSRVYKPALPKPISVRQSSF